MVRRTGLIDTAVDELRGRIESEQWPVGARIPPEVASWAINTVTCRTIESMSTCTLIVSRFSVQQLAGNW